MRRDKARCSICYRRVSNPKEHYDREHSPPERCPKCGQRGEGIVMRHWNRCM